MILDHQNCFRRVQKNLDGSNLFWRDPNRFGQAQICLKNSWAMNCYNNLFMNSVKNCTFFRLKYLHEELGDANKISATVVISSAAIVIRTPKKWLQPETKMATKTKIVEKSVV